MLNSFLNKYKFAFTYPCPRNFERLSKCLYLNGNQRIKLFHCGWSIIKKNKTMLLMLQAKMNTIFSRGIQENLHCFYCQSNEKEAISNQLDKHKLILFTFLEEYKKSGSFSSPYFILTIFVELLAQKQVALIRGDIMDYQIDKDEATFLTNQFLKFYMTPELYEKYIYTLNHKQQEFNYDDFKNHFQI